MAQRKVTRPVKGKKKKVMANRRQLVQYDPFSRIARHTNMVFDPCNAALGPTAYRGQDGFVQRFAKTQTFTTTTDQCFVSIYYPAYNGSSTAVYALPSSPVGVVTYSTPGPGQAFLLANADSQRPIGACIEATYAGTELNRQGLLYMGSCKASLFKAATTTDAICALLGHATRVPDRTTSVKWIPSPVDEEYWTTGAAEPESAGDRNVIVIVGVGFTAPVSFTITTTLIAEWSPNAGLGIATPSPNTADAPGGIEHVRSNLARMGNWWVQAAHSLEAGYQTARGVYNATRGVRAGAMALAAAM